jgi:orotidine-5'-phosphate decarboxylase
MEAKDRIVVALDVSEEQALHRRFNELKSRVGMFKLGLEAISAFGITALQRRFGPFGVEAFIDGKLHDIPNTMSAAVRLQSGERVRFVNVHASAGVKGMRAVVAAKGPSKVLAVTVLTSLDDEDCAAVYLTPVRETVLRLAALAKRAGVDGLICSPHELAMLRPLYPDLLLVTPGVRPAWATAKDDQERVMTPAEAVRAGADYLVIGRPILKAADYGLTPVEAAERIAEEIASA